MATSASSVLYAESSAIVAWLTNHRRGREVASLLEGATGVVASALTVLEVERTLIRSWSMKLISEAEMAGQSRDLALTAAGWVTLSVDDRVLERCRRPFPVEPVRALDAIHLATAMAARAHAPGLRLLTLDDRVRENGERLGFAVVP